MNIDGKEVNKMSRFRKLIFSLAVIAALVVFTVSFVVCQTKSAEAGFKLADRIAERAKKGEQLVIRVVYHNTGIAFAQIIKLGVEAAAREFGVDAQMTGPVD